MTAPIHVLQVAGAAGWAGGEVYLLQLAQGLDRGRFRLTVVSPAEGPLVGRLRQLGITTFVVPLDRLLSVRALRLLCSLLRREAPAIVQSHGARSNVYARLAGRLAGVPVILSTVHNSLYDYPVSPGRKAFYLALDRVTAPLSDRILCVADALARDLRERSRVPAGKIAVIRNGVDLSRFDPSKADGGRIRRELGLGSAPVVGIIGRMTPQKNFPDYFRGLARVRLAVPAVRGLVVGDGPDRAALETLAARLELGEACCFTGVRDDIPDLLAAMDVVVLASVSEGFPFAVLEALALGRPVVATRVSGVPELVEDRRSGLLVPPRAPEALAEGILTLLGDPGLAHRLGMAGRKVVEAEFSLEQMIRRLEALYVGCLGVSRATADRGRG